MFLPQTQQIIFPQVCCCFINTVDNQVRIVNFNIDFRTKFVLPILYAIRWLKAISFAFLVFRSKFHNDQHGWCDKTGPHWINFDKLTRKQVTEHFSLKPSPSIKQRRRKERLCRLTRKFGVFRYEAKLNFIKPHLLKFALFHVFP